jgi:pyridoxamine 5'-phosphate oxidase
MENPFAALCFYWIPLGRQLRIEGRVVRVGDAIADAYFASRARASQIGAWASQQSQLLPSHAELEARIADIGKQYEGREVPRPPHWSGWRLLPERFEFWSQGSHRLHVRDVYARTSDGHWQHGLLYP